jgi:hypothetical protein
MSPVCTPTMSSSRRGGSIVCSFVRCGQQMFIIFPSGHGKLNQKVAVDFFAWFFVLAQLGNVGSAPRGWWNDSSLIKVAGGCPFSVRRPFTFISFHVSLLYTIAFGLNPMRTRLVLVLCFPSESRCLSLMLWFRKSPWNWLLMFGALNFQSSTGIEEGFCCYLVRESYQSQLKYQWIASPSLTRDKDALKWAQTMRNRWANTQKGVKSNMNWTFCKCNIVISRCLSGYHQAACIHTK